MAKKKKPLGSLRDQLKDAGLVTAKQIRKAEKGALRQELRVKKGVEVDENRIKVERDQSEKTARDRLINEQINQKAQEKALLAQVNQLIGSNSQRQDGEIAYNFTEESKIKTIHISEENRTQLNKGFLAIVKLKDRYDLVPEKVAAKIATRRKDIVLFLHDRASDQIDEDDPYKDFPIPDDLDW